MPVYSSDFGIVIGINTYPDYNPLRGAVADATAFHAWLIDKQTGGGLESDNCALITSVDPQLDPPVPYQALIDGKLKRMLNRINQLPEQQGRFYFYFSGHGLGLDTTNVGLCLAEWSKGFARNAALQSNGYFELFKQLGKFREVFFFLDCCRVREFNVAGISPTLGVVRPDEASAGVKAGIVYATDFLNVAKEAALNLDVAAREVRGYFTKALIDGLKGEAATAPGGVTLRALQNYLEREVPARSRQASEIEQKPKFVLQNLAADDDVTIRFGSAEPSRTSTVNASETYTLTIINPNQPKKAAKVTVYDTENEIQFRGFEETDGLLLPKGQYTITTEFQKESKQEPVTLSQDLTYTVPRVPQRYTAALIAGAATSHEYYTDYAQRASRQTTRPPLTSPATGRLFLCIRRVDASEAQPGENLAERLVLLDKQQNVLTRFTADEVERNEAGYLALSAETAHGLYFLTYYADKEGNSRQLPLYVFEGWQTQVFILYKDGPQFGSTRVFLGRDGFSATDLDLKQVDSGMLALQNPTQDLPDELSDDLLRDLLWGKFSNPMVGIIGAYLVLQRQKFDDFSLDEVIRNLEHLLHATSVPDLDIIKYLAANTVINGKPVYVPPTPVVTWTFDEPLMLLWGLQALIKATIDKPETVQIATGSLLNTVAPRVYADSAWASWKHEEPYPVLGASVRKSLTPTFTPEPWVVSELLKAINVLPQKQPTAELEAFNADDLLSTNSPSSLSVEALSRQLGIPVGTVQQTMTALANQKDLIDTVNGQLRLAPDVLESAVKQWKRLTDTVRAVTLQDIPAVGFFEEMLLTGIGIQSVSDLIEAGQSKKTLKSVASQLNLTTRVVSGWINDAKKLL